MLVLVVRAIVGSLPQSTVEAVAHIHHVQTGSYYRVQPARNGGASSKRSSTDSG